MQQTIFDELYPKYKITKKIKLIEMFGGYGSQNFSLKYINANYEHHKLCEWAVKSIQAYKDAHCKDDTTDYSKDLTPEEIKEYLFNKGISSNYNEPMTKEQINRLSEKQVRTIYNNIIATHNLVNVQQVTAKDLEINDKEHYDYIFCYSFPCQDLSVAGKRAGMSDTNTRSGMLWEIERILTECKEKDCLPQILLMENVIQVHDTTNVKDFNKYQLRLEELGYKNYFQDLIATDYGIPQTRNRCFMVSILGDYNYTFPEPIPLNLRLKDFLEDEVDEKYYLSEKMKKYLYSDDDKYKVNTKSLIINREIACTKTTREGCSRADSSDYICKELPNNFSLSLATKYKLKRGYEIEVKNEQNNIDYLDIIGNYSKSNHSATPIVNKNGITPTIRENHGQVTGIVCDDLRIRRLTPRECGRLMGLKDEDITNILSNQSDSSGYHLFGDSIVCQCLMYIFKNLIGDE